MRSIYYSALHYMMCLQVDDVLHYAPGGARCLKKGFGFPEFVQVSVQELRG